MNQLILFHKPNKNKRENDELTHFSNQTFQHCCMHHEDADVEKFD
jgi:hypothetical protein